MKNCIMLWKNDAVDLAINNQRRAFSDAYNNEVLAESKIYIELSSKNPLSKLSSLETEDLKNTPCILVITGNPPHTGSAPVGFVHQYGSFKFLLFYVDDTESTCIHPPLL